MQLCEIHYYWEKYCLVFSVIVVNNYNEKLDRLGTMFEKKSLILAEMSSSLGGDMLHSSRYADANRLLTLRSSRASPGAQLNTLSPGSLYHRSSSLPRHFQTNQRILANHGTNARHVPLVMQTRLAFWCSYTYIDTSSDRPIYQQSSIHSDSHTSQWVGLMQHFFKKRCNYETFQLIPWRFNHIKNCRESGVVIGDENGGGDPELMEEISDSLKNSRAPSEQSLTSMLPPGVSKRNLTRFTYFVEYFFGMGECSRHDRQ